MTSIQFALRGSVAWVTMNRPEAMNASNLAMKSELREAFQNAERDPGVRVIVLTGNGRAFCAGGDLKESPPASVEEYRARIRLQQQLCAAIWRVDKPSIAAVNGYAIGGGLEMALACDIRLAGRSAEFGTPVSRIGSLSTGASHDRLARIIGAGRALHMVLCAESIDAETAYRIGLVSNVFDDTELVDETQRFAARIASYPAASLAAAKQAFRFATGPGLEAMLDFEEDLAVGLRDQA